MTPAISAAREAGVAHHVHEYESGTGAASYGEEAALALGVPAERVFKTLVVAVQGARSTHAVAIVPVTGSLDLKALAAALDAKKTSMADARDAERLTGYVLGGISPLGQRRRLPVVLDTSALDHATVFVSAGRRGCEIELAPADLARLCGARTAEIAR